MDESILTTIRFLNQIRGVHKLTPEQSLAIAVAIDCLIETYGNNDEAEDELEDDEEIDANTLEDEDAKR